MLVHWGRRYFFRPEASVPPGSRDSGPPFTVTLFGSIELHGHDSAVERLLLDTKAIALLAYVAISMLGRFVRRGTRGARVGLRCRPKWVGATPQRLRVPPTQRFYSALWDSIAVSSCRDSR